MSPKEESERLVKDIHKKIFNEQKVESLEKSIKISILLADEILDQYENKFARISKTETIARLVLTNHWNRVKEELNKKLNLFSYEKN